MGRISGKVTSPILYTEGKKDNSPEEAEMKEFTRQVKKNLKRLQSVSIYRAELEEYADSLNRCQAILQSQDPDAFARILREVARDGLGDISVWMEEVTHV